MKIYVRERHKVGDGVKQPKYRVVAITSTMEERKNLKIDAHHFRKTEIEQIAADVGAELVYLEPVPEERHGTMNE